MLKNGCSIHVSPHSMSAEVPGSKPTWSAEDDPNFGTQDTFFAVFLLFVLHLFC